MRFLTEQDLMEIFKISNKQAKALMRTKGSPSIKIGRNYRIEEQDLLDWIYTEEAIHLDYSRC